MDPKFYNKEIDKCYFCGGTNLNFHSKAKYWQVINLNFVECDDCGLIFANPMPGMEIVNKGNRALNILHKSRGTLSQYRGGKEFAFKLKRIRKSGVFLDIGCAEGIFLKAIEENSKWKAEGVEIIKSAVEFARKRLGLKIHQGTLESLKNSEGRYNYIRMNNVIEHVQNPVSFLIKANQILSKEGRVYCSTPNGVQDGHVLKTANKRGYIINLLENHFFYYPPKTLRNIFKSCSFKIAHSYSEDVSHSLQDFGITRKFNYESEKDEFNLDFYDDKSNVDFIISDEELNSYKNHLSVSKWRIKLNNYRREIFRFRFPYYIPLGHQQHIYARKN